MKKHLSCIHHRPSMRLNLKSRASKPEKKHDCSRAGSHTDTCAHAHIPHKYLGCDQCGQLLVGALFVQGLTVRAYTHHSNKHKPESTTHQHANTHHMHSRHAYMHTYMHKHACNTYSTCIHRYTLHAIHKFNDDCPSVVQHASAQARHCVAAQTSMARTSRAVHRQSSPNGVGTYRPISEDPMLSTRANPAQKKKRERDGAGADGTMRTKPSTGGGQSRGKTSVAPQRVVTRSPLDSPSTWVLPRTKRVSRRPLP